MQQLLRFKNLKDVLRMFPDDATARTYLEKLRWNDEPYCPHCGCIGAYKLGDGKRYKCKVRKCHGKFSVTVGTMFENSNIPLDVWFAAIYLITSHKKGISSLQLHRDLGVTPKTAWFMLHRIRHAVSKNNWIRVFSNVVEADETFVGGKIKNKHISERRKIKNKTSPNIKTVVFGMLQRDGELRTKVIKEVTQMAIAPIVAKACYPDVKIYSDSSWIYTPLKKYLIHESINHQRNEYVRGDVHTNTIEGFWSLFKRGIIGIYHYISPKHTEKYANEFTFRYNTRTNTEYERFNIFLHRTTGRNITYRKLIYDKDKM